MSEHDEYSEMLALLSIDAVTDEQRHEVEAHVATCPRCRAELDGLRDVAGRLGNVVAPPPPHVWTAIAQRLYDPPAADDRPPLRAVVAPAIDDARRRSESRSRLRRAVTTVVTFAAAAAIALLSVGLVNANDHSARLQAELADPNRTELLAALHAPGHREVTMRGTNGATLATFVLLKSGTGYLVSSKMPALARGETYQLWGVAHGSAVSLGLMGHAPKAVAFTVDAAAWPSELAVTVEPAGGTPLPTTTPVGSVVV